MSFRKWAASIVLIAAVLGVGAALGYWKYQSILAAIAAGSQHAEPTETVTSAVVVAKEHRRTTTSIGTVLALRSIRLRNEVSGMVRETNLVPGKIVDKGAVLVQLDVAVEEAELKALASEATLAETVLQRAQRLRQTQSAAQEDVEKAKAQRDVALAQIARTKAVIERKTLRAPFKARVGLADVHPGQFLSEGDDLTTLQGVDDAVHVDFAVNQHVAAGLKVGDQVEILQAVGAPSIPAKLVAVDAKVDPTTRNAQIRARVEKTPPSAAPGASVRVRIPVGAPVQVAAVPATAVRRAAGGDHVFVLTTDKEGKKRALTRQVQSGAIVGDDILIYSGLKPGEEVAASGSFKLREGALVAVAAPAADPKATSDASKTTSR